MFKKALRIFIWVFILFTLASVILFGVLFSQQEKVKNRIITEINKNINAPVDVKSAEISLHKFPYASILFEDVYAQGAHSSVADTLLFAQKLYLQFNVWEVLGNDIAIQKIAVEDGKINIRRLSNNRNNYEIWKSNSSSTQRLFSLKEVHFKNVESTYLDTENNINTAFLLQQAQFNGNFEKEAYALHNEAAIDIHFLQINQQNYIHNFVGNTHFELHGNQSEILIEKASLEHQNITLLFSTKTQNSNTLLKVSASDIDLTDAQNIIAEQGWFTQRDLQFKGKGNATLNAQFGTGKSPNLQLQFSTQNGTVEGLTKAQIKNIKTEGTYTLSDKIAELHIKSFTAQGNTGNIDGNFKLEHKNKPHVIFDVTAHLEMDEWLILFPIDTIQNPKGSATLKLHFENTFASLKNIKAADLTNALASGQLIIEKTDFGLKNSIDNIEALNGELNFNNNKLKVERLFFKKGKSDIYVSGFISNIFHYILLPNQTLHIDSRIKSQAFFLSDFMTITKKGNVTKSIFPKGIDLQLAFSTDAFSYKNFKAKNVAGNLYLNHKQINITDLKLQADKGSYSGNFKIEDTPKDTYTFTADLQSQNIDINSLFKSFNNFNQSAIVAENIYGTSDAQVKMDALLTSDLQVIPTSINLTSHLKINEGRLKNFSPMMALSKYANIDDLQNVQFQSLENDISISKSTIRIPAMEIKSNVLNLTIQGTHTFSNMVDYNLRLKLEDVLLKKRKSKPQKNEFDQHLIEHKSEDNPYIYIKMSGPIENIQTVLDKKSMGKSVSSDLKTQQQQLKDIFKKEDKKPEKEKDNGIIFEWEE